MSGSHGRRSGFSLIELLVVLAILAVLMSILLPAIQGFRESANRTRCMGNMEQLGLSLQQSLFSNHGLPPLYTTNPDHATLIRLLPYLEQGNLAARYDMKKDWYEQPLDLLQGGSPIFRCPTNPKPNQVVNGTFGGRTLTGMAPTDYVAFSKVVITSPSGYASGHIAPQTYTAQTAKALFSGNVKTDIGDVTDGLSNTIAFVEDVGRPTLYRNGVAFPSNSPSGSAWADVENWIDLHGFTTDGAGAGGPCGMNCSNNNEIYSFHRGGAVFAFGDGSVRFLNRSVNLRILAALTTRAGGERASPDF